jgi:transcriptional regulator with XRE-family HTH domain
MLNNILKGLRLKKELTQWEVARNANIDLGKYRKIEQGFTKNPSIEVLIRLADFFGVSIDDLVGRKPPKKGKDPIVMLPLLKEAGKKTEYHR